LTYNEIKTIQTKLLKSQSADLYDVLDKMGYPNQCLDINILPLRDDMKIAGPAMTILGTREPLEEKEFIRPEFDNWALFDKIYQGCVVVINSEKEDCTGHWGEMMSYGARNAGAEGVVIDGGTRDKTGILNIENWGCFSRYTSPVESNRRWRPREIMCPIYMTGTLTKSVRVNPGDWIFGDNDGVIVMPIELLDEAVEKVVELTKKEEASRKDFAKGLSIQEVFDRHGRA